MNIRHLLTVIFVLSFGVAKSQTVMTLEFVPKRDTILLGDQITLKVSLMSSKNEFIVLPEFKSEDGKSEDGIEVLENSAVDTVRAAKKDSVFRLERRYLLTSFKLGIFEFSNFIALKVSASGIDTLRGNNLSLAVKGIDIDKDFKPYDIKDIKTYPSMLWLWILLGVVGFLLLAGLVYFLVKKYRKPKKDALSMQKINPYEWAVTELEKLQNLNIETARTKDYYSQLTDIVREYIELQANVPAMEKTSDEILSLLPSTVFSDPQLINYIADLFSVADLVKFAKYQASLYECKTNWQDAHSFVTQSNIIATELKQSNNEERVSGDTSI